MVSFLVLLFQSFQKKVLLVLITIPTILTIFLGMFEALEGNRLANDDDVRQFLG